MGFLMAVWLATALAAVLSPALLALWTSTGLALLLVAMADAGLLWRLPRVDAERRMAETVALGTWHEVAIRVTNPGAVAVDLAVFDHYPSGDQMEGLPRRVAVAAQGWAEVRYRLRPLLRGKSQFGRIQLLVLSPLGIWQRNRFVAERAEARVYPNFAAVTKYALLATDNRLSQLGIRKRRRRGEGLEFHQLRDYRAGDPLRQIDWRATSRLRRLISREYQDERDQQVFFLLDCGRRMAARDDALSHFDHGLNAVLLLAHVALRQGDAVGLMTFAGEPRLLAPFKGAAALNTLLNTVYDLEPALRSPDYVQAATSAMEVLKKRSLVVLVTNLRDEDSSEVLAALGLLRRRHLVLLASLREGVIGSVLDAPVEDFDSALRVAATHRYLLGRRKLHDRLAEQGAVSLDVEPQHLPIAMVNRYTDIKRSGRL